MTTSWSPEKIQKLKDSYSGNESTKSPNKKDNKSDKIDIKLMPNSNMNSSDNNPSHNNNTNINNMNINDHEEDKNHLNLAVRKIHRKP